MEAEFDTVAGWTEAVVAELGAEYAVPAACRGSASPSALTWLAQACRLAGGTHLVDVGGGMGGPAAFADREYKACPTVVEPMLEACRAAKRLFGLSVVAGNGEQLALATGSADAAWCLGVLCTTSEKAAVLRELHRVLRPGAPLGLLVYVALAGEVTEAPAGNAFPTPDELTALLAAAGFDVADRVDLVDLPDAPRDWQERIDRVERAITHAHDGDPRLAQARDQEQRMVALLDAGKVGGRLLVAHAAR
jgi:SAM-dependent methyltransferase